MNRFSFALALFLMFYAGAASAERLRVEVNSARVRSGPGTEHKILWEVEKYHPLEVIKKKGSWYYFRDFEGDKGWIFKKLVRKAPSVIIIKDKCNVRSGPGTNFPILFTVERGVPFRVLKRKESWINVRHSDGDKGWIHKSLVW